MVFLFCQATDADDKQVKGIKMGVLTVLDDDDDAVINFALVLEETIVLKDIPDTPTALAYLFVLLYSLNMEFPKDIRYTFETIQHIFMEMSTNCSQRVRSFKTKLLNQWFIFHGEDLFYPVCSFMFGYFVNLHIDHLIVFMLFLYFD